MKCKLINEDFKSDYGANLLRSRGVEDVEHFLRPLPEYLQSPEDLDNIDEGARLLLQNVGEGKKILLIVDCDCDGYVSSATFYQYIKLLAPETEIDYWIHSGKQHGLEDHIERIMNSSKKYNLVVLPDSSSNDFVYHERLKEIKTPCLVLDHHLADVQFSDNAVIINNQISKKYLNKDLCGVGVVYQFCRYLDSLTENNWADEFLDITAVGLIGDMMSMLSLENRYIVYKGLKQIKNNFLINLMKKQGYSITGAAAPTWDELVDAMNPMSVAFYIVPLINAEIRVGTMEEKTRMFEAFIDGDKLVPSQKRGAKGELVDLGEEVARECTNARSRQNRIKDNAVEQLEQKIHKYDLLENKVLFVRLEEEDYPSELNGLIAMQLSARHKRPTIVARLNDQGFDRGSMRGPSDGEMKSLKEFLQDSGYFEYVQGHDFAAGCSIPDANLKNFHAYANEKLKNVDFGERYFDVNFVRSIHAMDLIDVIYDLASYDGIWGQANNEPLIYIKDIHLKRDDISIIGKNKDTIRFEKNGITYIKFKAKDLIEKLSKMSNEIKIELVGKANLNEWCGRTTPQVLIEDIEFKNDSILDF